MKILIIAPYFAPSSEVPSVRMVSFSNYLYQEGFDVTVMCWAEDKLLTIYNKSELNTKIPDGINIITFDSKVRVLPFLDDLRFGRELTSKLDSVLSKNDFQIVFVTCGPYFSLQALPKIKKKYQIPYVLDFRDLGALNYRPRLGTELKIHKSAFYKRIIKAWYFRKIKNRERRAVLNANGVICISKIDLDIMKEEYKLSPHNSIIATNGFDENKLINIYPIKNNNTLVGAIFGKFMYYSEKRALSLLKAIDMLNEKNANIKLVHIGRKNKYIIETIKKNNINEECYECVGLKEYSEGMKILGSADFFMLEDTSPDDVGTKIYDYIYWNKPIIAAIPKDIPLAKLVKSFQNGFVCETDQEILNALRKIQIENLKVLDNNFDKTKFSRKYQNMKMKDLLEKVYTEDFMRDTN